MKKILVCSILLLSFLVSYSQQDTTKWSPIKYCKTYKDFSEDSVFAKGLEIVQINVEQYKIVKPIQSIEFRNSLDVTKTSHTTTSVEIFYKSLNELTVNSYRTKKIYVDSKKIPHSEKRLVCYRTLTLNDDGKYKIYFYLVE